MNTPSFDAVRGPRAGMIKPEVGTRQKAGTVASRLVPSRDNLIDAAFAAALTAITLYGMHTGFFGWAWITAGAAGLVVGLLVAHLTTSFRLPAVVTLVGLVLAYFLLGGPLAVRNKLIAGVLPSGHTFHDLLRTPVHGWKEWLTMLPPVDAAGPLLALPFLVGLLGAAVSYAVARVWRSPYAVVVMPLVLLVGSIALGTVQPAGLFTQGAVGALLVIGWMISRAHRNRPPLQNGAGKQSRLAIGAALITVAGLAGYLAGPMLPGGQAADQRVVVRSYLSPPFDVAQLLSPLAGFRQYTKPNPSKLYDKTLMTVTGLPAGTPLRLATLDNYDGSVWGAGDRAASGTPDPGKAFQQVGSKVAADALGRKVSATISLADGGYKGVWLPTAGTVTGVKFTGRAAEDLQANLWLNTDTDTAIVPQGVGGGDRYTLSAVIPPATGSKLPGSLDVASGSLLDSSSGAFLDSRMDAWTGGATGSWQKLVQVADYMTGDGAYTDGGTPNSQERYYLAGHSSGRLQNFAGADQLAGDDEQYASTLALVANRIGIPARVVMGAIPEASGVVKGADVHAWVEVQKTDGTWFQMLPQTFLPDRNKKPNEQRTQQQQQKTGAQVPPPSGVNPPSILQGPDQAQNATNLKKIKKSPFDPSSWPTWLRILVLYVLLPLLVLAALFGLVVLLKFLRSRKNLTRGPTPHRIAMIWRGLTGDARSVGVSFPRQATRIEQAQAFPNPEHVWALAHRANHHVFGPGEPDDAEVRAFWTDARAARKQVLAATPVWRQLLAAGDPRPLLARDPARVRRTGDGLLARLPRSIRKPRNA